MTPDTSIALSISLSKSRWEYRIEDPSIHEITAGEYAATVPPTLKVGDQEVFAVESYTNSRLVFAHMGNLTLDALRINGRKTAAGWYAYGSWDTRHNPLFVVGGLDPPPFISLQETDAGTLVWGYEQWSISTQAQPQAFPLMVTVSAVAMVGVLLVLTVMRKSLRSARNT
jgi:hypothetical protein